MQRLQVFYLFRNLFLFAYIFFVFFIPLFCCSRVSSRCEGRCR